VQDRFLHEIGGKGLFIKELETALVERRADFAVHSLKDMPAAVPSPFALAAVLERHSPLDAMIFRADVAARLAPGKTLDAAALAGYGALKVGTGSLRRICLLARHAPEVTAVPMRGNVDTRLRKLEEGEDDAIILAAASLERLGITNVRAAHLTADWFVPSAGQGALAIETLEVHPIREELARLESARTRQAVTIERAVLRRLGGDCALPFGCFAAPKGDAFAVHAIVLAKSGKAAEAKVETPMTRDAEAVAAEVAAGLAEAGGQAIFAELGLAWPKDLA
jgi:hydroxymethylbilane synthase